MTPSRIGLFFSYPAYFSLAALWLGVEVLSGLVAQPAQAAHEENFAQAQIQGDSDYLEARQYIEKHQWPEAVIALRSVLKRTPDFAPAAVELAHALVYTNRREEALNLLNQWTAKEKGDSRLTLIRKLRVLSRVFLTQENFQAYQDALNLMTQAKYQSAIERFEKALKAEPYNVEILTRLGQCFVLQNDYDSAAEKLRIARKLNPFEPEVHLWLGRALQIRGELSEALNEFKEGFAGLPESELAPVWFSEALTSVGQKSQALSLLESDVKLRPQHLGSLVALAKLRLQGSPRKSAAIESARRELRIALSRFSQTNFAQLPRSESDLGVQSVEDPKLLKADIQRLLEQLENINPADATT